MAKKLKLKYSSREELKTLIYSIYSINEIVDLLIDYVIEADKKEDIEPITITKEQFTKYFKIKGLLFDEENGEVDKLSFKVDGRGRPTKSMVDIYNEAKELENKKEEN